MRSTEQKPDYALSFHTGVEYYIITPESGYICSIFFNLYISISDYIMLDIINHVMKLETKIENVQNPLKISVAHHDYISSIVRWNDNAHTTNLSRLMP